MVKLFILLTIFVAFPVIYSNEVPKKSKLISGNECAPGSFWRSQCNDCRCSNLGLPLCTRAVCTGDEPDPVRECAPGTRWINDCNTCRCDNGTVVCTLVECDRNIRTPSQCLRPIYGGICRAHFLSYGYNSTTEKCESFIYGGCEGNSNRFDTKLECEITCNVRELDPYTLLINKYYRQFY